MYYCLKVHDPEPLSFVLHHRDSGVLFYFSLSTSHYSVSLFPAHFSASSGAYEGAIAVGGQRIGVEGLEWVGMAGAGVFPVNKRLRRSVL